MAKRELPPKTELARRTLVRHGYPGGLVRELIEAEIDQLASIGGNDAAKFDAFWGSFQQRLVDAKATSATAEGKEG